MNQESLSATLAFFLDIHDLVLVDEEIRRAFAGQTDHVAVVIFDPAVDDFAVGQLHAHRLLLFAEELQVRSFFKRVFSRNDLSLWGTGVGRIHAGGYAALVQAPDFPGDTSPRNLESNLHAKFDRPRS